MNDLGGLDEVMNTEEGLENDDGKTVQFPAEKPKRRPFHYWNVGGRDYRLKLNTAMIEKLESKYRQNIFNIVTADGIPALSVMLTITQAAMTPWEHGIGYADVKKLYDKWTEEGGSQMDFYAGVIMPTMAVSGFFTQNQAASILESLKDADVML